MVTLGLACEKASYSWCVVARDNDVARLVTRGSSKVPINIARADQLLWLYMEVQNLVDRNAPAHAVLKRAESGGSGRSASLEHAEMDGVTLAALASRRVNVESLKWATIASRLSRRSKSDALAVVRSLAVAKDVPQSHLDPLTAALVARPS